MKRRRPADEDASHHRPTTPSGGESRRYDNRNGNDNNSHDHHDATVDSFHRHLVEAIFRVGIVHASPARIVEHMILLPGSVTNGHIKSHLQRFRKRATTETITFMDEYDKYRKVLADVEQRNRLPGAFGLIDGGQIMGGKLAALISHLVMMGDVGGSGSSSSSCPPWGEPGGTALHDGHGDGGAAESSRRPHESQHSTIMDHVFIRARTKSGIDATRIRVPELTMEEQQSPLGTSLMYIGGLLQHMEEFLVEGRRNAGLLPPPEPLHPSRTSRGHKAEAERPNGMVPSSLASVDTNIDHWQTTNSSGAGREKLTPSSVAKQTKTPNRLARLLLLVADLYEQNVVSENRTNSSSCSSSVTSSTSSIIQDLVDGPAAAAADSGRSSSPVEKWLFDNLPARLRLLDDIEHNDIINHGSSCSCCSDESSIVGWHVPFGLRPQSPLDMDLQPFLADDSRRQSSCKAETDVHRNLRETPLEERFEGSTRTAGALTRSSSSSMIGPSDTRLISENYQVSDSLVANVANITDSGGHQSLSENSGRVASSAENATSIITGSGGYQQHLMHVAPTTVGQFQNFNITTQALAEVPSLLAPLLDPVQYGLLTPHLHVLLEPSTHISTSQTVQIPTEVFPDASTIDLISIGNLIEQQINQLHVNSLVALSTAALTSIQQNAPLHQSVSESFSGIANDLIGLNLQLQSDSRPVVIRHPSIQPSDDARNNLLVQLGLVQQAQQYQRTQQDDANAFIEAADGTSGAAIDTAPTYPSMATGQQLLPTSGATVALAPIPQWASIATPETNLAGVAQESGQQQQGTMRHQLDQQQQQQQQQPSQPRRGSGLGLFFPVDDDGDDASI